MDHQRGVTDVREECEARRDETGFARHIVTPQQAPRGVKLLQEGLGSLRGAIGDPGQVTDLLRRYERPGPDEVIFLLQAGRYRPAPILSPLQPFPSPALPPFTHA